MNLFELPQIPAGEEITAVLAQDKQICIKRIVSCGASTDWYDQDETEFVCVLEGEAEIEFRDGSIKKLCRGDTLLIPLHQQHRVAYTTNDPPCVWLCVFY